MSHFDRFDVCAAYYCYAAEWHSGQWSKEYLLLGVLDRLRYRPGLSDQQSRTLNENARSIYDHLVRTEGAFIRDRRS